MIELTDAERAALWELIMQHAYAFSLMVDVADKESSDPTLYHHADRRLDLAKTTLRTALGFAGEGE